MRLVRLGKRPVLGIQIRVTNDLKTGKLRYHLHFIMLGYHFCFMPKSGKSVNPIALFGSLCRR